MTNPAVLENRMVSASVGERTAVDASSSAVLGT
jgi:hypothetical protein